jgi:hypothetical protein
VQRFRRAGTDEQPDTEPDTDTDTDPTPTPVETWPLTGRPADGPTDGPVVVVKVDNTTSARPQQGLRSADLVVEEVVEGGVTRLAVMVHSRLPDDGELVVGPVRSVRSSDVGIVGPTGGALVASGGAPPPLADLQAAGIPILVEGSPGFFRDFSRPAPYNLFVELVEAAGQLATTEPPPDYLDWADGRARPLPGREDADSLVLRFSSAHATEMVYDTSRRTWSRAGDDSGFTATTVLALLVETADAGYLDPGGNPVPVLVTTGSGRGWLAHRGQVAEIEWSKRSDSARWRISAAGGGRVEIPAGRVYLALLPLQTGSVQTVTQAAE